MRNAFRGYSGPYYRQYTGLITDKTEREHLAIAHNSQTGTDLFKRKLGIHAMTHDQKVECGRKGGLIRGPLSYELRIGCHALPPEVLREHCRRIAPLGGKAGAKASVIARGEVPYTPTTPERLGEMAFAHQLAMDPRYRGPGRVSFKRIAEELNIKFHAGSPHYTRVTLKIALQRERRHSGSNIKPLLDPEISFAKKLAQNPSFQLPARIKAEEIAREVNREYHAGRPVRNSGSIRAAIKRFRKPGVIQP